METNYERNFVNEMPITKKVKEIATKKIKTISAVNNYKAAEISNFKLNRFIKLKERTFPFLADQIKNKVIVEMESSSINPIDIFIKNGIGWRLNSVDDKVQFPIVTGMEGFGTVVETGKYVLNFKKGDKVVFSEFSFHSEGSHATHRAVDQQNVAIAPKGVSKEFKGAFSYAALTAIESAKRLKNFKKGCEVLVIGGSGAVGSCLIQMLAQKECTIDSLSGRKNISFCRGLGVRSAFSYADTNLFEDLGKRRYDAIIDCGKYKKADEERFIPLVKGGGHFLTYNNPVFETVDANGILKGMAKCIGESLKKKFYNRFFRKVKYSWMTIRPNSSYLKEVVDMVEQKKLNIRIDSVFPLSKLGDAFQRAESDECKGKVVILNSFKNYKKID